MTRTRSPGPNVGPSSPPPARTLHRTPSATSHTSASPSSPTTVASRKLARPRKLATKGLAGRAYSSSGVPTCWRRPPCMSAMRSERANASSWSCVTKMAVIPMRSSSARSSTRVRSRSAASRFESGSSRRRTGGSGARARASATRCCWPPESSWTRRLPYPARSTRASASSTRRRTSAFGTPRVFSPKATFSKTSRCGKSA